MPISKRQVAPGTGTVLSVASVNTPSTSSTAHYYLSSEQDSMGDTHAPHTDLPQQPCGLSADISVSVTSVVQDCGAVLPNSNLSHGQKDT